MNARADAAAASARQTESPGSLLWPGPVKPGFLVVEVHPGVRDAIREEEMDMPLPGNLVANRAWALFKNPSTIARSQETIFARRMYGSPSASAPIGLAISLAYHQTYQCWVKVMTDSYPTNQWLSKVGLSPLCHVPQLLYASGGDDQTLCDQMLISAGFLIT